jgi:hypothetical protein
MIVEMLKIVIRIPKIQGLTVKIDSKDRKSRPRRLENSPKIVEGMTKMRHQMLLNHCTQIVRIIAAESTESSIKYNKPNEGKAINHSIIMGQHVNNHSNSMLNKGCFLPKADSVILLNVVIRFQSNQRTNVVTYIIKKAIMSCNSTRIANKGTPIS